MTDGLLEMFTRQYIEAQSVPEVTFIWQGGEPTLMGVDFFRQAIALQQKYRKPGMTIHNAFQTNGTTLDDAWGAFFKQHHFLIGLSLDGPPKLHDAYRMDRGGNPTFEKVIHGLKVLQRHQVNYNILTCVHAANADQPLEVYRFLRDEVGAKFIQFIPVVEREDKIGFRQGKRSISRSVSGRQYGQFLIAIFNEWVQRDVGRIYVQIFDTALAAWLGKRPGLCVFEETCGLALAIEHTGDLYCCDHFVEDRCHLGNIPETPLVELVASEKQLLFGRAKRDSLPDYCRKCNVRFICNGGCPKNRILCTPNGEPGLNWLCEGYQAFFRHINQPMKVMATLLRMGRPPADIMGLFQSLAHAF